MDDTTPLQTEEGFHTLFEFKLKMDPDSRHPPELLLQNVWSDSLRGQVWAPTFPQGPQCLWSEAYEALNTTIYAEWLKLHLAFDITYFLIQRSSLVPRSSHLRVRDWAYPTFNFPVSDLWGARPIRWCPCLWTSKLSRG